MPLNLIARILPYEVLLFLHHAVSILLCYAVWCHIPADKQLTRWFMYAIAGIFLFSLALQAVITLYRNWFWFQSVSLEVNPKVCVQGNIETETQNKIRDKLGRKFGNGNGDQAGAIKHPGLGTGTDFDYVQVTLNLRKPLMIQPGQYIRLWVPLDFTTVVQSHPFAIADWSPDPRRDLELFVEVRRGLTKKLREELSLGMRSNIGMFTGPYGRTLSIEHYETILLVATGFGVAALIPYLQWLVHAVHSHKADVVPMHLFWQITSWSKQCFPKTHQDFSPFIKIHMYFEEQGSLPPEITWFARQMAEHERVNVGEKPLPLEDLLNSETVMSPARDGSRKTTMIAVPMATMD
ncbi:hypothetical protein FALBO_7803 [Fusarium albosuccineum]|uniref:ferric-chelate reductase (NADPH) n=1 Tax=Fusarium albosuccineum TaxID=1237068 RepID=A0A8H4LCV3_9HYPO|nr:hypothetical protein FALBO_7803 [Fusarium albosuccineum]